VLTVTRRELDYGDKDMKRKEKQVWKDGADKRKRDGGMGGVVGKWRVPGWKREIGIE